MARVFYSMAGEGRGHATRVRTVVEELRGAHRITLFAPRQAYALLRPVYAGTEVEVREIPGLVFSYRKSGRLDYPRTLAGTLRYLKGLPTLERDLCRLIREREPDLVITDFEPALPRAAKRCGVPFISLNHQHFLVVNDLSSLPRRLQWKAAVMGWIVSAYYQGQVDTIVSSFYAPPIKAQYRRKVTQVGALLRPEVMDGRPLHGDYLVAYLRRHASDGLLRALDSCQREVRIYGLGEWPDRGNLRFLPIHQTHFVKDLAGCYALVSTAGNQLVGEALYLGKPVLAIPEPNNFEQYINAHFLKQEGTGDWVEMDALTPESLAYFLERVETFREAIDPNRVCGNQQALDIVRRHLTGQLNSRTGVRLRTAERGVAIP